MKIAVFSAFPQELKYICKSATELTRPGGRPFRIFLNHHADCDIIAVETGMSTANLEKAFAHIADSYRPDMLLSVGFGGALYYSADIGDLVLAKRFFLHTREGVVELAQLSQPRGGSLKPPAIKGTILAGMQRRLRIHEGSFVTISEWMTKSKLKALMPNDAPFPVCDRETVHLAKMAYRTGIPFFAIRSITDQANKDIPEPLFEVTGKNGTYQVSRAISLLVSRPHLIPDSLQLGWSAARASKNLWKAVKAFAEVVPRPVTVRQH